MRGNTDQFRIYTKKHGWLDIIVWHYTGGPQPGSFCMTMTPFDLGKEGVFALRLQGEDTMLYRIEIELLHLDRALFWYTFEVKSRNLVTIPTADLTTKLLEEELI